MQLCDICEIDTYISVFQDYYCHIRKEISIIDSYLPLFFAKIPNPWGQKLINTYIPRTNDTLEKRVAHVTDKLSEWCEDYISSNEWRNNEENVFMF